MILKALAEERKSENTGLQVMNVIKYQKPKTRLEFKFQAGSHDSAAYKFTDTSS